MPKRSRIIGKEGLNDAAEDTDDRKPAARQPNDINKTTTHSSSRTLADLAQHEDSMNRVTPHMERLLRLIEEGTSESAQMAAGQLTNLTKQSSAVVLWEVLGRLQAILQSMDSWQARQNAAMAMEGIAGNIPVTDQLAFFQDEHSSGQPSSSALRITDISAETVLKQGQELFATAPSRYEERLYETRESELEQLDQKAVDFVQERIKRQRRILAERLGLAGICDALQICQRKRNDDFNEIVSNDDLAAVYQTASGRKRQRREEKETDKGIGPLLVREMSKVSYVDHHFLREHVFEYEF